MQRLGLSDEELCATLDSNPIEVISGSLDHRPELPILLQLTAAAEEAVGAGVLARWVRTSGPSGRPIDQLVTRDFMAFEASLTTLLERGFVIGGGD
ncbi:MAG: hypothetical protein F2813_01280 [Actinobacteria bacterium]|nr:hypothetical protein [Actinomycetota bacterium]